MYQQFQFDRDAIVRAAEDVATSLAQSRPGEDPAGFAARVIAERLRKAPGDYLQYGPWWWSVKNALREQNHAFGDADSATLRAAYGTGLTTHQVLVAGEQFREYYRTHLIGGTATFALDTQDEEDEGRYSLFDIDMEIRRQGLGSLAAIDSDGHAIREPDEPILDDVRVPFEEGGELWTAVVSGSLAAGGASPESLVAELLRSGRIGRAIDVSNDLAGATLDGIGPAVTADSKQRLVRIDRCLPDEP
jgi:hypothetical protein